MARWSLGFNIHGQKGKEEEEADGGFGKEAQCDTKEFSHTKSQLHLTPPARPITAPAA